VRIIFSCIIIDDFRGEISLMGKILGFKFFRGRIFIEIVFKKIKKFIPNIKLNNIYGRSLVPLKKLENLVQIMVALRIS
jgi:hypothetical protein